MNICLCGWKGSGKSRAAARFKANGYEIKKFATPLKRIISTTFKIKDIENAKTLPLLWWEEGKLVMSYGDKVIYPSTEDFRHQAQQIVSAVLRELGLTEFGAQVRVMEASCSASPISQLGGITANKMVEDVMGMFHTMSEMALHRDVDYRVLLQQLGTDVMRKWDEQIHVKMMAHDLESCTKKYVIDDARFPNELDYARKMGAKVVWLHRPALVMKDFHESEVSICDADCDLAVVSREAESLDATINYFIDHNEFPKEDLYKRT